MDALRYPIGAFEWNAAYDKETVSGWIDEIEALPGKLREAIRALNGEQLNTPYRPGGWTVRQVVHHVADSHMNSYIRCKLAITEDRPVIKPYREDVWAETADCSLSPEVSLRLLDALTERWVALLRSLTNEQLQREFLHPESGAKRLDYIIGLYTWHGAHHLAHIENLKQRMGWS
ncbi:YfiT family bacillithiol transferase [Paenibacillus thermotolerans]|uniref:YfiT family bacillithiol transferase n=1 Tax=Paenibacillus thermotolerans TaxID=3027807 RepID=UPI00236891BF|nr:MULTISPECIES: bacillithiol transferase BstA [unclassified Paenibacillus]